MWESLTYLPLPAFWTIVFLALERWEFLGVWFLLLFLLFSLLLKNLLLIFNKF